MSVQVSILIIDSVTFIKLFWLGGIGFSNAIVWAPFIKKALVRAVSFSSRHHRVHITSNSDRETVADISYCGRKDNRVLSASPSIRTNVIVVSPSKSTGLLTSTDTYV